MHIAIVTMVYNEHVNLPIWIRHYKKHCPGATLFVIDHGSDDGSTRALTGVNVVALPRTPYDDPTRSEFLADFQHALLRFHEVVIYTDCDEMLVADPRKYTSLAAFLSITSSEVIAPVGLDVHHLRGIESAIDLNAAILGQRRYVQFSSGICKPSIARVPLLWTPGFHFCDRMPDYRADIYLFHVARMDAALSLNRLSITRGMAWSEAALRHYQAKRLVQPGKVARQLQTDEERIRQDFERPEEDFRSNGAAPFVFEAEMRHLIDSIRRQGTFYQGDFFRGPISEVPEVFFGLI